MSDPSETNSFIATFPNIFKRDNSNIMYSTLNQKGAGESNTSIKAMLSRELASKSLQKGYWAILILQCTLIILFAVCSTINPIDLTTSAGTISQGYNYFIGVEIMMFIGFGYLMTFIKNYGLGAVGYTMLVTAIGLQWYVFCESFFHQIYHGDRNKAWEYVDVTIYGLMNALFGVSAVLISFGAVIGKLKPFQLVLMTFLELIFHAFNYEVILVGSIKVADVGGTYADHMFGAYFGLSVAYFLKSYDKPTDPPTGYIADWFSFFGTLFLWIYWPSFVGGGAQADSVQQTRAVVNTILALSASTICAFYMSIDMTHGLVLRPVDIQNATLAGGVAIGCIANLNIAPVNAILVGCFAGLISTFGFQKIQPFLLEKFGLHDSCGVHNLHGIPSLIGAIASICLAAYKQSGGRDHDGVVYETQHGNQAWRQFVGALLTIACGIIGGAFTAFLLNVCDEGPMPTLYDDSKTWEVAHDFGSSTGKEWTENEMRAQSGSMHGPNSALGSMHGPNSSHGSAVSNDAEADNRNVITE